MNQSPLARKLGIKPGHKVALVNAPGGVSDRLEPLPEDASLVAKPGQDIDVVVLFTKSAAEVDSAKRLIQAAQPDGLLWVAYPKGGKKAGTDILRAQVGEFGWPAIFLVAVDETWSAMRFRPADMVAG